MDIGNLLWLKLLLVNVVVLENNKRMKGKVLIFEDQQLVGNKFDPCS